MAETWTFLTVETMEEAVTAPHGTDCVVLESGAFYKKNSYTGQWLAQDRPADVELVPAGTAGQTLQVDAGETPAFVSVFRNITPLVSSQANTAAAVKVFSYPIEANAVGSNGHVRMNIYGQITNVSGLSDDLTASLGYEEGSATVPFATVTSQNYQNGHSGLIKYESFLVNRGAANDQTVLTSIELADNNGLVESTSSAVGNTGIDMAAAWTPWVAFTMGVASASFSWLVFHIRAEVVYVP